jgi:hypothetical protein
MPLFVDATVSAINLPFAMVRSNSRGAAAGPSAMTAKCPVGQAIKTDFWRFPQQLEPAWVTSQCQNRLWCCRGGDRHFTGFFIERAAMIAWSARSFNPHGFFFALASSNGRGGAVFQLWPAAFKSK